MIFGEYHLLIGYKKVVTGILKFCFIFEIFWFFWRKNSKIRQNPPPNKDINSQSQWDFDIHFLGPPAVEKNQNISKTKQNFENPCYNFFVTY